MKKVSKAKKVVGILMLLILLIICVYVLLIIKPNKEIKLQELEKIKFDYILYDRDTNIYKEIFSDLNDELNKSEIDYEKYATYLAELFVIDLYTLNNKTDKDDIGGVQFVMESAKDNFKLNASSTMYKYISSSDMKDMPEVNKVYLVDIENSSYNINGKEYESYIVNLTWEYKKDLGYDSSGEIYVVKDGEQLFVVEKK